MEIRIDSENKDLLESLYHLQKKWVKGLLIKENYSFSFYVACKQGAAQYLSNSGKWKTLIKKIKIDQIQDDGIYRIDPLYKIVFKDYGCRDIFLGSYIYRDSFLGIQVLKRDKFHNYSVEEDFLKYGDNNMIDMGHFLMLFNHIYMLQKKTGSEKNFLEYNKSRLKE